MNINEIKEDLFGCFDKPDNRDIIAEEILGVSDSTPSRVDLRKPYFEAKYQGSSVACTTFSVAHCFEIQNENEHNKNMQFNPFHIWDYMVDEGQTSRYGASLQDALRALMKLGFNDLQDKDKNYTAKGYARIRENTSESWKNWLSQGYPIHTGAMMSNIQTRKNGGIWQHGTVGHSIACIGYKPYVHNGEETTVFIFTNSYGKNWGSFNDGTLLLLEKDLRHFFSAYIIYDKKDGLNMQEKILINRMKSVIRNAKRLKDYGKTVGNTRFEGDAYKLNKAATEAIERIKEEK